jgi:hypothetical protein
LKKETRANKINDLALTVLGYSSLQLPCPDAPHILDLVHFFVNTRTGERETEGDGNNHVLIEDGIVNTESKKLKLKSCALSLQAAGVSFKVIEDGILERISCFDLMRKYFRGVLVRLCNIIFNTEQVDVAVREVKGLDFNFKFRMGKLEIAQLHITETTKAK